MDRSSLDGHLTTGRRPSRATIALGAIVALAAILRFVDLPTRGTWDADQGHDMLVLLRFVQEGVWPLLGPPTSIGEFHHGALYYYVLAPAAWLSGSDPVAVVGEIALLGAVAVGIVWWLARSVAGPVAGLVAGASAALVMAVSGSAIEESTFIWNPNLIAFSSSLTVAAAWRAWTTRSVRWWLLAAAALALTMQSHVLGIALVVPVAAWLVADARRRDGADRRRAIFTGVAGLLLIGVSYIPLAVNELQSDFAETGAAIEFLTGGGQAVALDPVTRLVFVGLRILAWPLTGLLTDAPVVGTVAAVAVVAILIWRLRVAGGNERWFTRWLAAALAWCWVLLGLGVAGLATVTPLPVDHYHAYLDPLVFVVLGLGVAGLWQGARAQDADRRQVLERVVGSLLVVGLVAWNVTIWPSSVAADGGWPAARAAGDRIEASIGADTVALLSLPEFKSPEAYTFPLVHDGRQIADTSIAGSVVIVCDALFVHECSGAAEEAAVAALDTEADGALTLIDRFEAAPGRTISVYRRT